MEGGTVQGRAGLLRPDRRRPGRAHQHPRACRVDVRTHHGVRRLLLMTFQVPSLGGPNVGKSTLFNRLAGKKLALVDDTPGVTRDRRIHPAKLYDLNFDVIDTAGFETAAPETLQGRMRQQTEIAIREADLVIFLVDA